MMKPRYLFLFLIILLILTGCQTEEIEPLPPDEYLENALNWIEVNAVKAESVDWEKTRQEVMAQALEAENTADTYPALIHALDQLNDSMAFLVIPNLEKGNLGILAVYPENIVVKVDEGSPAESAGIQVGDVIKTVDGAPPQPMRLGGSTLNYIGFTESYADVPRSIHLQYQRGEETFDVVLEPDDHDSIENQPTSRQFALDGQKAAYLDLPLDPGTELYPTQAQEALAAVDGNDTCGWIIDLRLNTFGDLWTYLAALGPLLGEGEVGGFVYRDGSQEMWSYRDGKVYWGDEERFESYVRGPIYDMSRPSPPIAFLIGSLTHAAGELTLVAFQGSGNLRTFGEPTSGSPYLSLHTPLSDGVLLNVSGAYGMDRNGQIYNEPIQPDEIVEIDWQKLGQDDDPVIQAALTWLDEQPACN